MSTLKSSLLPEIKQTRPFRSRGQEGAVALLLTADRLRRHIAATVGTRGITPQQYNVLRILRGAADQGLPTLEIAARMIEAAPGITRLLDRMEVHGLVRRERCSTDRRQVLCWITKQGARILEDLDAPVDLAERQIMSALTKGELSELLRILKKLRIGLDPGAGINEPGAGRN